MDFLKLFLARHLAAAKPGAGRGSSLRREDRRTEEGCRALDRRLEHQHGRRRQHKQIADSAKFTAGLNMIVDGVVECLNASIWAKARAGRVRRRDRKRNRIIGAMPAESKPKPLVGVIMGSRNDYAVMRAAVDMLREFGVPMRSASSRRTARPT
jgi:hypothetical protein